MTPHILKQKIAQNFKVGCHFRAKGNNRGVMVADIVWMCGVQRGQMIRRIAQKIFNKYRYQAAHQLMRGAGQVQGAVAVLYVVKALPNLWQPFDIIDSKKTRPKRVIKIMRQIGNIIGKVG